MVTGLSFVVLADVPAHAQSGTFGGYNFFLTNSAEAWNTAESDGPYYGIIETPAAVPEASTTVSLGLLLALGLGGVVVGARRRRKAFEPTPSLRLRPSRNGKVSGKRFVGFRLVDRSYFDKTTP